MFNLLLQFMTFFLLLYEPYLSADFVSNFLFPLVIFYFFLFKIVPTFVVNRPLRTPDLMSRYYNSKAFPAFPNPAIPPA